MHGDNPRWKYPPRDYSPSWIRSGVWISAGFQKMSRPTSQLGSEYGLVSIFKFSLWGNLSSGRLEKTTKSSPHHVAQHRPTVSKTSPPEAPRSSRFGSELPAVEDDVDIWRYAIVSCMPETTTTMVISGGGNIPRGYT